VRGGDSDDDAHSDSTVCIRNAMCAEMWLFRTLKEISEGAGLKPFTALSMVAFEVTEKCNLSCRFCYRTSPLPPERRHATDVEDVSYEQALTTLEMLFCSTKVNRIIMTGGEPMLADRFSELVLYCRQQGTAVTVISNGTAATAEAYNQLVDHGVDLFEFSLHADDAIIHDALTGSPGSWRRSLQAICDVKAMGVNVRPAMILTRLNIGRIKETMHLIKEIQVSEVVVNRFNIGGRALASSAELSMNGEQMNFAYSLINQLAGELDLQIVSNVNIPHCLVDPQHYPKIRFMGCTSDPLKRPITISANGDVRFCSHSPVIMGNINIQSFSEIISSGYAKQWQSIVPDFCADCPRWNVCQGGCRAAAEQMGLSLANPDPVLFDSCIEQGIVD